MEQTKFENEWCTKEEFEWCPEEGVELVIENKEKEEGPEVDPDKEKAEKVKTMLRELDELADKLMPLTKSEDISKECVADYENFGPIDLRRRAKEICLKDSFDMDWGDHDISDKDFKRIIAEIEAESDITVIEYKLAGVLDACNYMSGAYEDTCADVAYAEYLFVVTYMDEDQQVEYEDALDAALARLRLLGCAGRRSDITDKRWGID